MKTIFQDQLVTIKFTSDEHPWSVKVLGLVEEAGTVFYQVVFEDSQVMYARAEDLEWCSIAGHKEKKKRLKVLNENILKKDIH